VTPPPAPLARRLLVVAALGALAACGEGAPPPDPGALAPPWTSRPAAPEAACADCHPAHVESWRPTAMARALGPVEPGELAGLPPVDDLASGFRYALLEAPVENGGAPRIVETRPDSPSHRLEVPLAFAIGAGELDRSYAARLGELLWFAPLEVVTGEDGRRRPALAPGHAITPGLRFGVAITDECLGCHTDRRPPARWPLNLAVPGWEPAGIGCAACHGAAPAHAAWREAELTGGAAGDDPLVRPGALGRVERLSVCAACHLQGDVRIELEPGAIGTLDPGADVLDRRAIFVARTPTDEVGFVSQVERLVLSRCFLGSEMTCETCHDPHVAVTAPEERARVRGACLDCHAPGNMGGGRDDCALDAAARAADGGDCASCHLPETGVFDVAEVTVHDHWIRRDPPRGAPNPGPPEHPLRIAEAPDGDWRPFAWPGEPPPAWAEDPGILLMAFAHGGHLERVEPLLDRPPGPAAARLPMYHHVRGTLLEAFGRAADAEAAYAAALALDPDLGPSATNLGLLLGKLDRHAEGLTVLNRFLERHPRAEGALRNRAVLLFELGNVAGFARDLAAAQAVRPRAENAANLAVWAEREGRADEARRWREIARTLEPRAGTGAGGAR